MNQDSFLFPIENIEPRHSVRLNLELKNLTDLKHFVDGSNAKIYTFSFKNIPQREVAKLINYGLSDEKAATAIKEFRIETEILLRCQHPNIVKILGVGHVPQIFMCLEYLQAGTLQDMMLSEKKRGISGFISRLIKTLDNKTEKVVRLSIELASALKYLHDDFHPDASIIHRDLKPDNIGFTTEGQLKLFDFGLSICVKKRSSSFESYKMTGMTGSPRYMAPEVYNNLPYTEKVDVHSFGVILWQLCSGRLPYEGFSRKQLEKMVIADGLRPESLWNIPQSLQRVMTACWTPDPADRPPFSRVLEDLTVISTQLQAKHPQASSCPNSTPVIKGSSSSSSFSLSLSPPFKTKKQQHSIASTSFEDNPFKVDDTNAEK